MIDYPLAQRIEHWPIDKLILYARNPRTHSDTQVAQIAASIAEFGFNNPILVDTKLFLTRNGNQCLCRVSRLLTVVAFPKVHLLRSALVVVLDVPLGTLLTPR